MDVTFWGTRGSVPVPGPDTVRYGGNTTCVSVRTHTGRLIILDAGTGIRCLGKSLAEQAWADAAMLFLSHSHWDHIQGFPLFAPVYDDRFSLRVLGCPSHRTGLERVLALQQAEPVFPVPLSALHARIEINDYCMDWAEYQDFRILAMPLIHPGGACGFRIEEGSGAVVFMTDNELPDDEAERARFVAWCRDADLLIHDAQYTDEELETHRGWGHSSISQAVQLAIDADVKRLALFHHDPDRTDDDLDALLETARTQMLPRARRLTIFGATERDTIVV